MQSIPNIQQTLQQVSDRADDLIFAIDRDLNIQFANAQVSSFFGYPPEEMIGKSCQLLFGKGSVVRLQQQLQHIFKFRTCWSFEQHYPLSDRGAWLDARLNPITNKDGEVVAILGIIRDVTERRRREELITASKQAWRRAVDNMPSELAVVDCTYRIERVNQAMAERLGVKVQTAVGLTCYEQIHNMDEPPSFCPLIQESNGNGDSSHTRHVLGDALIAAVPLRDQQGITTGCLYLGRKLTEAEIFATIPKINREYINLLMRNAQYIVYIQDQAGKYVYVRAIPSEASWPREIVGKTPYDIFDTSTAARQMEQIKKVKHSRKGLSKTSEMIFEGKKLHFHDMISPIEDESGSVVSVVTISRKIAQSERGGTERKCTASGFEELTQRESEILHMITHGMTNQQIAEGIGISKKMVETHRSKIMQKLNVRGN